MSNEETKVCKWCGRELPIFEYGISSYNQKRRTVCKACYSERRREKQLQLKLADGLEKNNNGELVKIRRKYKKPYHFQILYRSESGIDNIAKDEVFVRLFDYKSA